MPRLKKARLAAKEEPAEQDFVMVGTQSSGSDAPEVATDPNASS